MNSTGKYLLMMTISITHEYYGESNVPVELIPDGETKRNLHKYNIIYKRKLNKWYLYGIQQSVTYFKEIEFIRFLLHLTDPAFLYVTSLNKPEVYNCFMTFEEGTIKKQIDIPVESLEVKIKFRSLLKHYEYILFSNKKAFHKMYIKSNDATNTIEFEEMNIVPWKDKKAIQFRSKNKILLTKFNHYNFSLIEKAEFGERIILQNINSPDARSLSLYEPYDTITAYHSL